MSSAPILFAYTEYPIPPSSPFPKGQLIYRPMAVAELIGPRGLSLRCFMCLDTGADHCIFPLSFAAEIGLNPLTMPSHLTAGCGSSANVTYYGPVQIEIIAGMRETPKISFETFAGFTDGMDAQGIGLLGGAGFFERHVVSFNHSARQFSIQVL